VTVPDIQKPANLKSANSGRRAAPIRLGVICDYAEEGWPSMDLVGDMLCQYLAADSSNAVDVTQLRPAMRRRFSRVPLLGAQTAANADRLANRFWDYPRWLSKEISRFDLFHLVDHSYSQLLHALPAGRTVVTCHDLDTFRSALEPAREKRPRWFRLMAERILEGFRKAAYVIAVSEATRSELLRYGIVSPNRVRVIPNGTHPVYSPLPEPVADAEAARLLPGDSGDGWLLNVGSNAPRKRIDLLLQVFAAVRQQMPGVRLARVGSPLTDEQRKIASDLKIENAIIALPSLSYATLAAVYRRAGLLVHTAEAEGFGLTIVEAMASGCLVVASDLPVLYEVAGTGAVFCPVGDVPAFAESVVRILQERGDPNSRWGAQRQLGLERAAIYQWTKAAGETAEVYREVLNAAG
jgi:glycosyltransferase involved in cell wall biosynthesis